MRDNIEGRHRGSQGREKRPSRRESKTPLDPVRALLRAHPRALGGTMAILVAAIAAFGVTMRGSGSPLIAPVTASQRIKILLAGIPQQANTLGDSRAPVTLEYFGDLQCRVARQFTIGALPFLIRKWVRNGQLKIEFRSIRSATLSTTIFKTQQVAAQAAGTQGKMWYYVEFFYHEQEQASASDVSEGYLQGLARQVPGLSVARWARDRHDPALAEQVVADQRVATSAGFSVSPSFLVKRTDGRAKLAVVNYSTIDPVPFNQAIEKMLAA
jgi:Thioredoxin